MTTKSYPKPTGTGVRNLHERLIKQWTPRLKVDEDFQDIVHQRNRIEVLEDSDDRNIKPMEIHSGRAGLVIDHANGLVMAMPSFSAQPLDMTTEAKRESEQVERVCAALFQRQLLLNDFWPSIGRDVLIYARAFVKAMPLPSAWIAQEGYPVRNDREEAATYLARIRDWKEQGGKLPFIIQYVPALSILPLLDSNDHPLATIEEKWVTAKILSEEFRDEQVTEALERRRIDWYDELAVVEYLDHEWVSYLRADLTPRDRRDKDVPLPHGIRAYKTLRTWKHGLGRHPVVMIPGIRTEMQDYESHFKSFLADAKDALQLYDFLLSRLATMVSAYYLPSYEWRLAATSATFQGRERPTMDVSLGGVTVTYADEKLSVLPVPQGLPDATVLLQQVDDVIQRATLEDVLFGRVPGSAPAFQVHLRINVAKSRLTPIAQHMAAGLTQVMDLFLRGVEQLGEAVVVGGEKITTRMAKRYRERLVVSILPKSPVDRSQEIGVANMALQFGLPWDWIAENILDIQDPATLRLQKEIHEIEQLPPVKEKLMADALEQLEILVEDDEFVDTEGIDLSQLPPEFGAAVQQLLGAEAGPDAGGAGGGGPPYPEGAAPQTVQGGRGLTTQNTQPAPGAPSTGVAPPGGPSYGAV